jgi:hypothetical protein
MPKSDCPEGGGDHNTFDARGFGGSKNIEGTLTSRDDKLIFVFRKLGGKG